MTTLIFFKHLTQVGYFSLMIALTSWITLGMHSPDYPTAAWLLLALVPLLFPLRGILYGRPYTYAWTSFLMLFYFTHGIGELYSSPSFAIYAALEVLLSLVTFIAALATIRLEAKSRHSSPKTATANPNRDS